MPPVNEAANDPATAHATNGAAHWLATLTNENCSEAERQQFLEWLRSSTHHVDEFLRLSTLARNANRRDLWPEHSIETLIAEARASTNVTAIDGGVRDVPIRAARKTVAWALAASAAGILAVGALLFSGQLGSFFAPAYSTQIGEQRSIALSDGSVVELNSKSSLRTDFSESLRAVELTEGEAIFRVAKDASRPFRVRAGTTDIVAVGTAFNVNASDSRTVVTVLEGRVRVNQHADRSTATPAGEAANIELAMGEQLIVARGRAVRLALHDTAKVTSWTDRRLIFEDTALSAAAAEFARYSPRAIRIEDAQLGGRRINGVFDATDPASLVEFLASDDTVEVRQQGEGWVISSRTAAH